MALGTRQGAQAPALVRPCASSSNDAARRRVLCIVASVVLTACVCAIFVRSGSSAADDTAILAVKKMELAQKMTMAGSSSSLPAELAFGDSSFHSTSQPAFVREGSVRNGVQPAAVHAPKHIANVGLQSGRAQALTEIPLLPSSDEKLTFGDAAFHLPASVPSEKEGSVRGGVKPDFKPPLGSLGQSGLADDAQYEKDKKALDALLAPESKGSSTLAFGDSSFMKSLVKPDDKEGSVRGSVKPDFSPPLGDLGDVGLKTPLPPLKAQTLANTARKHTATSSSAAAAAAFARAEEKQEKAFEAQLAFGDAAFHSSAEAAAKREGSVRGTKKPDFSPPLGDLGSVGLKPSSSSSSTPKEAQTLVAAPHLSSSAAASASHASS
eukprot:CAMPEP_0181312166 /NCGR_PEP_ID=MMETSP1101-20121128/13542_1 /TAXON_ID=46948 /ORGANISM="Rhodomonas abbreviata, Strain Caron Lab Isolate" /LENGTH=379 /DNA_ID=CAMNT_0023418979 /DNA_START=6 /DNA_END=1143 /DNA_ORIENTATION=+